MGFLKNAAAAFFKILETAEASVDDGPTGGWTLFVDTDGIFKQKDESGNVRFIGDLAKLTYVDLITDAAPATPPAGHIRLASLTGDDFAWIDPSGDQHLITEFPGYGTTAEELEFGNATASGTSLFLSRADHEHEMPAQQAANADTSGASLGDLETEVNELKAALRAVGILAT